MTKVNAFKMVAGLTWAALALSTATPAGARVATSQWGEYAACSATAEAQFNSFCMGDFYYMQRITFIARGCNGGSGCADNSGAVYTDFAYGTGRKVTFAIWCDDGGGVYIDPNGMNYYELDTCAC